MKRINSLVEKLKENKVNSVLISDPMAIYYLLNEKFSPGERFLGLLVKEDGSYELFVNNLFPCGNKNLNIVRFDDCDDCIAIVAKYIKGGNIGIDKNLASGFLLRLMEIRKDLNYFVGSYLVDEIRAIKDEDEQELMMIASTINDEVMKHVRNNIRLGMSEKELETIVLRLFKEHGVEISFFPIVAFKENAADPHAIAGDRILQEGDSIIIDMGCKYQGYCSDMTRTFFVNKCSMEKEYNLVKEANLAAEKIIRPGIKFKDIDKAARDVIENAGYGKNFFHRTGHGIGIDVHEPYDVSAVSETVVKAGMCFSIEPGIYIEGVGGIRVEDLVLVTEDGCKVLNCFSKDDYIIYEK